MADTPAPSGGGSQKLGFLSRKMGPAPVWLWGLLIVGAYYAWTKYKGGSSSATAATDPATGVPYAQELQDSEASISSLQAQVNQESQGQTAPSTTVNITETEPGSGTPEPDRDPQALAGSDYRDLAIQALKDKGIKDPTPGQIADEQNDIRSTVGLGKQVGGKPPPGGGSDAGVTPPRSLPRTTPTTKTKARAKPKRPAGIITTPVKLAAKPKPVKHPAHRGEKAA